MYATINFKTKKALREAVAEGVRVGVFNPGPFGGPPANGTTSVEGPHYPQPHRWYAQVTLVDGVVTGVK